MVIQIIKPSSKLKIKLVNMETKIGFLPLSHCVAFVNGAQTKHIGMKRIGMKPIAT
jgi:hypothetical protein